MNTLSPELQAVVDDGLKLCRAGDWNKGLPLLASAIEQRGPMEVLPGAVYSFLGYGVARYQGKIREGMKLCEHGIKLQYYDADNHWNLARVHIVAGDRLAAFQAISRGLKLDPEHEGLLASQKEIGERKPPVLKFLKRDNPLNVWLGKWRHARTGTPGGMPQRPPQPAPKREKRASRPEGQATK